MEQPIEVADIFRQFGAAYRRRRRLPLSQLKAMSAIERCRTAALGGHVDHAVMNVSLTIPAVIVTVPNASF
jgi:hypothetical protein